MSAEPIVAKMSYCSQCGECFAPSELTMISGVVVCARCKPAFLRRLQEGSFAALEPRYKGFWIRLLALLLDNMIVAVVYGPVMVLMFIPLFQLAGQPAAMAAKMGQMTFEILGLDVLIVGGTILYRGLMMARFEATVGKMAIGARVIVADGSRLTTGRAFGRAAAQTVSDMTMCIGYLLAAFDDKKRTLHDRIAGTLVVAK